MEDIKKDAEYINNYYSKTKREFKEIISLINELLLDEHNTKSST